MRTICVHIHTERNKRWYSKKMHKIFELSFEYVAHHDVIIYPETIIIISTKYNKKLATVDGCRLLHHLLDSNLFRYNPTSPSAS